MPLEGLPLSLRGVRFGLRNNDMNNDTSPTPNHRAGQLAMGIGALIVAAVLAWGALAIPSDAGYAGVGPNFLPWVISAALGLCGVMLIREVLTGGPLNSHCG